MGAHFDGVGELGADGVGFNVIYVGAGYAGPGPGRRP